MLSVIDLGIGLGGREGDAVKGGGERGRVCCGCRPPSWKMTIFPCA